VRDRFSKRADIARQPCFPRRRTSGFASHLFRWFALSSLKVAFHLRPLKAIRMPFFDVLMMEMIYGRNLRGKKYSKNAYLLCSYSILMFKKDINKNRAIPDKIS
jgi:hypothetical protein